MTQVKRGIAQGMEEGQDFHRIITDLRANSRRVWIIVLPQFKGETLNLICPRDSQRNSSQH